MSTHEPVSFVRQAFAAPAELQAAVAAAAETQTVPTGKELFRCGERGKGVYLVMEGTIELTLPDGGGKLLAQSGSLLGLPATVSDKSYSLTAIAVEPTTVRHLDHQRMRNLLATDGRLCLQTVEMLSEELQALRTSIKL